MIVVSDTTPLRYLIEIGEVHILEGLFAKVTVPEKVIEELQDRNTPQEIRNWIQSPPSWLEVKKADASLFTPMRVIQEGEHQAIALAFELKADALLCDDSSAIREAHRLNLPTLRLYNILEKAAEKKMLDLPEAVRKMERTNFHAPPDHIVVAMLERDAERKLSERVQTVPELPAEDREQKPELTPEPAQEKEQERSHERGKGIDFEW